MSQSDRISIRPMCFGTYTREQRADRACGSCKSAVDCIPPMEELTMVGCKPHDPVNRPAHYQGEIECIDAIRAALGLDGFVAHCRGTAIKYAWRAGKKGEAAECLRKGAWYLTKAAEALEAHE